MIIKIKHEASEVQIEQLKNWIKSQGLSIYFSEGEHNSILGLIGDTSQVDESLITVSYTHLDVYKRQSANP